MRRQGGYSFSCQCFFFNQFRVNMSTVKTNYFGHDRVYQAKRNSANAVGWDSDDASYEKFFGQVTAALPALANPPGVKLLELGCGAGNLTLRLAGLGCQVTGVDIAPSAIAWANERRAQEVLAIQSASTFKVDNVLQLNTCADASFDVVIDGHCLHCIIGGDRALCLAAVRRILRPGGKFLVVTMCGEVRVVQARAHQDGSQNIIVNGTAVRHIGTSESIIAELVQAGFEIESVTVEARENDAAQDDLMVVAVKG
jgi:ubiquinone/menaquinone biosynthesis C-methylase UbiE